MFQANNSSQVVPELGQEQHEQEASFPPVTNPSPMGGKGFDFLFSPFGTSAKFDLPPAVDYTASSSSSGPSGLLTPNTSLLLSLLQSNTPMPSNTQASPFALAATAANHEQLMLKSDPLPMTSASVASSALSSTVQMPPFAVSSTSSSLAAPMRGVFPTTHLSQPQSQSQQQFMMPPIVAAGLAPPARTMAAAAAALPAAPLTGTSAIPTTTTSVASTASTTSTPQTRQRQQRHQPKPHIDTGSDDDDDSHLEVDEDEEEEDVGEEHGSDSEASFSPRQQQQQQQQGRKGRKRKAVQPLTSTARTYDELTDDQIAFMDFKELMRLMLAAGLTRQDIAETKARRRRLKNRQSARLCSNKKRELCNELSSKNSELHDTIERLQREVERLKKENAFLKQQMR